MIRNYIDPKRLIQDFSKVAALAGIDLPIGALEFKSNPAPHLPQSLPSRKIAVYVFSRKGQCLKVGRVGLKSQARFTSQHYLPDSSRSNLAKSLLTARAEFGLTEVTEANVGDWIRANVDRLDFLLDAEHGIPVLALLESFLQCRLKPRFEGFRSQQRLCDPPGQVGEQCTEK